MIVVNVRSPYFITVDETGQVGSKVELFIWNDGTTEPTDATYTFTKRVSSLTDTANNYNISNFIKEYIDNSFEYVSGATLNDVKNYVNFKVKRYNETTIGTYNLLDTTYYSAVNGYTLYLEGYNNSNNSDIQILSKSNLNLYYNRSSNYPYVEILVNITLGQTLDVRYQMGAVTSDIEILPNTTPTGVYSLKVPITASDTDFDNGNKCLFVLNGTVIDFGFTCEPICEPKYTPVVCSFTNRYGGASFLTFFKAQTNTIDVKGTTYKFLSDSIDYDASKGQSKSFYINGTQTVKLNTGWVDENYGELITDLFLSETVLLDGKPVDVKTQNSILKTHLKDKNINYEIEFEYAFNLINDVV